MNRRGAYGRFAVIWLVGAVLLSGASLALAQPRLGGSANPADLQNPYAYGINPALADLTHDRVAAGYSILHLGFLDDSTALGSSGLAYAGHRSFGGLSAYMGHINTPLSNEFYLTAGYGRRVWQGLMLGAGLGLQQRGFNKSNFVLEEPDPVLQGGLTRTKPTLSLAAAYQYEPLGLTGAVVLENPHEPNLAVDNSDAARLPQTWRLGVGIERTAFTAALGLITNEWATHLDLNARWYFYGQHALTGRLATEEWALGARIAVSDNFWVEYNFAQVRSDLASESSGTQSLVISWHRPGKVQLPVQDDHRQAARDTDVAAAAAAAELSAGDESAAATEATASATAGAAASAVTDAATAAAAAVVVAAAAASGGDALTYSVEAADDTVGIRVKRLVRHFADVDSATIGHLPRWRVGVLDSTWSDRVTWSLTDDMIEVTPESQRPGGKYSTEYVAWVGELAAQLRADPDAELVIAAESSQFERARYLAERVAHEAGRIYGRGGGIFVRELSAAADSARQHALLQPVGNDSLPSVEQITLYEHDTIVFLIHSRATDAVASSWSLAIHDTAGQSVRTFGGQGAPPDSVRWDWRDDTQNVVPAGSYRYRLGWRDRDGKRYWSPERSLEVTRHVMQRTLTFTRQPTGTLPTGTLPPVLILDRDHGRDHDRNRDSGQALPTDKKQDGSADDGGE